MNDRADDLHRLGAVVRARRRELGLRQRDLAELAACSERFVHMLEHGKPTVQLAKVLDVLEVLGLGLEVGPGRGDVSVRREPGGRR
jgi:HTH-type transcriptional regulator/antitoxin HipB